MVSASLHVSASSHVSANLHDVSASLHVSATPTNTLPAFFFLLQIKAKEAQAQKKKAKRSLLEQARLALPRKFGRARPKYVARLFFPAVCGFPTLTQERKPRFFPWLIADSFSLQTVGTGFETYRRADRLAAAAGARVDHSSGSAAQHGRPQHDGAGREEVRNLPPALLVYQKPSATAQP